MHVSVFIKNIEKCVLCNIPFYVRNSGKCYVHLENSELFHDKKELSARCLLFNILINNLDKRIDCGVTVTSDDTKLLERFRAGPIAKSYGRVSLNYTYMKFNMVNEPLILRKLSLFHTLSHLYISSFLCLWIAFHRHQVRPQPVESPDVLKCGSIWGFPTWQAYGDHKEDVFLQDIRDIKKHTYLKPLMIIT